ncbi:2-dehydropantoate 2-reductase [Candidatus Binatia bacterium]|nr:2-dehydropantoate 2-reductase [Candidatus Binatia bacterium]
MGPPRVLVVGAGGVGGYYAGQLAGAGHEVTLVARGAHAEALRAHGLRVRIPDRGEQRHAVGVVEDPRDTGVADLILVAVKSYDTEQAARLLAPCAGPDTIVLSLQNGPENEDVLARATGLPPLLLAVTYIGSEIAEPGVIAYSGAAEIVFGEPDGASSPRARRLSAWLDGAGVKHRVSSRIRNVVWDKLAWNAAFNAITSITRRNIRGILDDPAGHGLIRDTMQETLDVAHGLGIDVPVRIDASIEHSRRVLPDFRTSMLQDLERGKRLEHDALNGAVVRAGLRAGVATPLNATFARLLATIDPHGAALRARSSSATRSGVRQPIADP